MVSAVPQIVPRHVAITMDGNGRWAAARGLARTAGHKAGLDPVRMCIQECTRRKVAALTLFAFSSENWRRPAEEVGGLMSLFVEALDREIAELDRKGVRVRFIGERRSLAVRLQARIAGAEERTGGNGGLKLQVALSYGGRWDIVQAAQKLARDNHGVRLFRPNNVLCLNWRSNHSHRAGHDSSFATNPFGKRRLVTGAYWNFRVRHIATGRTVDEIDAYLL